jgi:UDP-N-acetylglucosamine acyltransferase
MARIHATAIVEKGAELAEDVFIGPYCIVGPKVKIHAGVELASHIVISNETEIGSGTKIYPFASLGAPGQIYQEKSQPGRLVIGKNCEIRENVTINCGTSRENRLTKIGDDCMFMVAAHVAHDCVVGKNCIFANNATLGGHVKVGDQVFIGGLSAVHQFCQIGEQAIIGGVTGVFGHVIPYGNVFGNRAHLEGLNLIGLERRGFLRQDIQLLNQTFRRLFLGEGVFSDRLEALIEENSENKYVQRLIEFIRSVDKRRSLLLASVQN